MQDNLGRQSFLHWIFMALGLKYAVLLSLAGLVTFVLTVLVISRGKGGMAGAALVFIVPLPLLVGLLGALDGAIASFEVIAASAIQPKPSEVAAGVSMSLVAPWIGTCFMFPSYLVAMLGLFVRSLTDSKRQAIPKELAEA